MRRHGGGSAAPENVDASPCRPGNRYEIDGKKMNARAANAAAIRERATSRAATYSAAGPSAYPAAATRRYAAGTSSMSLPTIATSPGRSGVQNHSKGKPRYQK